jgi:hypothetical protein
MRKLFKVVLATFTFLLFFYSATIVVKSAVRPRAVLAKEVWLDRNVVRRLQATMSSFRHIRLEKYS